MEKEKVKHTSPACLTKRMTTSSRADPITRITFKTDSTSQLPKTENYEHAALTRYGGYFGDSKSPF